MSDSPPLNTLHEPHPWAELNSDQVLDMLVYELYGPVSALGSEVDRLATGAFEDDELITLLGHLRASIDNLSRIVVLLKHYSAERKGVGNPPATTPEEATTP